ncbi:MAG: hypothetical protein NXI32_08785 [bacterium]|nr:hypothetical protein [bacterium]
MQHFRAFRRTSWAFSAILVSCALAVAFGSAGHSIANGPPNGKSKKNKPAAFVFYKLLETEAGGGDEPFTDGNAYWYGQGKFVGSPVVYDLKVTLPEDRKFPGFGKNGKFVGPGYINPTEMTYEISLDGVVIKTIVFKGWASPKEKTFFLHDGTVDPVEGWPGAFACLPTEIPSGFSFKHKFNKNNIQMFGTIKSVWMGQQRDPCGNVQPSAGPLLVEGTLVFPKGMPK